MKYKIEENVYTDSYGTEHPRYYTVFILRRSWLNPFRMVWKPLVRDVPSGSMKHTRFNDIESAISAAKAECAKQRCKTAKKIVAEG